MNMDEKDLEKINQIDMECNSYEDDDDCFEVKDSEMKIEDEPLELHDGPVKTGVILDFSDEPEDFIESNVEYMNTEDEDDDKELVEEDMIQEKKKVNQGEVEADYWKKLQKKHAASNTKGAYNTSFHFAGNPQKEMDMFNQAMGSDFNTDGITSIEGSLTSVDSTGGEAAGDGGQAAVSGGEGGFSESLHEDKNEYQKMWDEVLNILGFEILGNSDGSYIMMDQNDVLPDIECSSKKEIIDELKTYFDECFIYPLEIKTGLKFDNYQDWVNWFDENKAENKELANDIKYCDLFANHIDQFEF